MNNMKTKKLEFHRGSGMALLPFIIFIVINTLISNYIIVLIITFTFH